MSQHLDGPALFAAAQNSLAQSGHVSMDDGHAQLCATQAVAQALLALTAATVDSSRHDLEVTAAWRRAVHPEPATPGDEDDES